MSDQRAHSRFGGSSAPRWLNCAGSVALLETLPPQPDSPYAAEGTVAHKLGEMSLTQDLHPSHWMGEAIDPNYPHIVVTQEMVDAVVVYCNAVTHEVAQTKTAELYVEQGFVLDVPTAAPGEVFGTNDAMVYHPKTGRLRVFDYKHGVGLSVDADDNAQLKFYAAGAVFSHPEWKISEIVLTIVQPRARDADEAGAVKDWTFDLIELLEYQGEVEQAINLAKLTEEAFAIAPLKDAGSYKVGPWCDKTFCTAKRAGVCPAVHQQAIAGVKLDTVGVTDIASVTAAALPAPKTLDLDHLAAVVGGLDIVNQWLNQCREYLEGLVLTGHDVPGWKAVEKIGRAKWVEDPQQIVSYAAMMHDIDVGQLMPPKLATITEAEKLLKAAGATKDQIDDFKLKFTVKESSGLTVAPASDRRPAVDAVARDMAGVNLTTV